jgi:hypothetical protein
LSQLELERLVSQKALHGVVLLGDTMTDVPSLCTFLEIFSRVDLEYDFDEANDYSLAQHTSFCLHWDKVADDDVEVMALDLSPTSHVTYLWEKAKHLKASQIGLEAKRAELERWKEEIERPHGIQREVNNHVGALCLMHLP